MKLEDKIDKIAKEERDSIKEQSEQLNKTQSKYTYFLLFIAASAIALVIKITEDDVLSLSLIPLGLALLSWGYSFYCGCHYIISNSNFIRTNIHQYYTHDPKELFDIGDKLYTLEISQLKFFLRQFHYLKMGCYLLCFLALMGYI